MKRRQIGVIDRGQPSRDGELGIEDTDKCSVRGFPRGVPAYAFIPRDIVFFGPRKIDWIVVASHLHSCRQCEVKGWFCRQIWSTTPAEKPKRSQRAEDMTEFGFQVHASKA